MFVLRRIKSLPLEIHFSNPNQNYFKTEGIGAISVGALVGYVNQYPSSEEFPSIFIVPDDFNQSETNILALDFAILRNLLVFGRKTKIIVAQEKQDQLREYLKLGLYQDFDSSSLPEKLKRQLKREYLAVTFRHQDGGKFDTESKFSDFVEFLNWDSQGKVDITGVVISKKPNQVYQVLENNKIHILKGSGIKPLEIELKNIKPVSKIPNFGVTILGANSGFDVSGLTSNYIVWSGEKGILVDVGEYTLDMLSGLKIKPEKITDLVLTHIHEDHTGGLIKFLNYLERSGQIINLIISRTVLKGIEARLSFLMNKTVKLKDYFANIIEVEDYLNQDGKALREIKIDDQTTLEPGFTFHPVPTIWGKIHRIINGERRTISFSADHIFDLEYYQKLYQGEFSEAIKKDLENAGLQDQDGKIRVLPLWRKNYLERFPFYKNGNTDELVELLIFDLGGFGIHTDPRTFEHLPPSLKPIISRMVAVHTNQPQRISSQEVGIMLGRIGLTIEITEDGSLVRVLP